MTGRTSMAATAAPAAVATPTACYLGVAIPARLADEGARVALVLLALAREHSASLGGLLVAALMVPHVVAAPVAGALADWVRHRKLFHGLGLAAYGTGLAATAWALGRLPTPLVLLLVLAAGCCAPLVTGGLTSLLAELLPERALTRAFSIDSTTYNLAGILGPALAAILATTIGPGAALFALGTAALIGACAVTLLRLPVRPPTKGRTTDALRPAVLAAGAREILSNPPLRSVTWASSIGQIGIGALPVITALLATERHAGWAAGGLMTAFAVGAMAGSLTYAVKPWTRTRPERVVLLCLPLIALPLALAACVAGMALTTALFATAGWATGPLFSTLLAARERYAPQPLRTQIFTLGAGLKSTAAAAGAAGIGALGALGAAPLLGMAAAAQIVAAGLGVVLLTHSPRNARRASGRPDGSVGDGTCQEPTASGERASTRARRH
ncbi:MFS transporter [Streptomyces sp. MBT65]|uniref:MFS transporter n=1 Tax=Streptomyces sp. MBT65 TaxID=1488395 RepID=UPI0019094E2A|nr:MFS transporter [Streptomyces sp. MBT65]MBK3575638.1 MFS transporter [Streptomyces sp. MBT65]